MSSSDIHLTSPTSASSASKLSYVDKASLGAIRLIHKSTEKKTVPTLAHDLVIGQDVLGYGVVQVVWELEPKDLSLLPLAIIIDLVHKHAPLYSLLKNQCYWFVHTICNGVVQLGVYSDIFPN